jgi:hypothetical protein
LLEYAETAFINFSYSSYKNSFVCSLLSVRNFFDRLIVPDPLLPGPGLLQDFNFNSPGERSGLFFCEAGRSTRHGRDMREKIKQTIEYPARQPSL